MTSAPNRSEPDWQRLASHVQVELDPLQREEGLLRLHATRRRRAWRRRGVTAASLAIVAAAAAWMIVRVDAGSSTPGVASVDEAAPWTLEDGSRVFFEAPGTDVRLLGESSAGTTLELRRGRGRFSVVERGGRPFRVRAGDVAVEVLGTEFVVERRADRVRVAVRRGRVRVAAPGGVETLGAGDRGDYAAEAPDADPGARATATGGRRAESERERAEDLALEGSDDAPPEADDPESSASEAASGPKHGRALDWRRLAELGRFDEAHRALRGVRVRDRVPELLLAADVYRFSGHPDDAAETLSQLVERHARDRRAPLAAFTLGRVELEQRGRPRAAAAAFARARALRPTGNLAEDALAREVQSWSVAGEDTRAEASAREYLRRYPEGRRRAAVTRYGGLE